MKRGHFLKTTTLSFLILLTLAAGQAFPRKGRGPPRNRTDDARLSVSERPRKSLAHRGKHGVPFPGTYT